ncbi:MAG: hypothetical protein JSS54_09820 [Proteobacteria bacterium]|nr:hypothetical protein [Pseudomonadota bacterium]MBS0269265.1 hypothetical protein [Pseudomonadota bacterium]
MSPFPRRRPMTVFRRRSNIEESIMTRDIILWLAGVPLIVIIGLHLFGFLH